MGKTPRERLLIMLLPALVIVGGYLMGYARDKELEAARAGLASARASAVSYMDVLAEQEKIADVRSQLDEIKKEKTQLDARWSRLGSMHEREAGTRIDSVRTLSKMLWDCGLHSFEESIADDGLGELPPSFQGALRRLKGDSAPVATHRLWKIRFIGRYADVMEALESLRDSGSPIIPVSISMSETRADTQYRSWTLLLWI